jgi:TM2 domain-containing membrane protein YozV
VSLGLTPTSAFDQFSDPPHKSAGLAFLLSLFIPGLGQLYCGKGVRASFTFVFFVIGILLCFAPGDNTRGLGISTAFCLWIFSFLDAYFTAQEINQGTSDQVDVSNPRVAVVLNLLTAGLGYFYLGERTKGIVLFILLNILKVIVHSTSPFWSGVVSLLMISVGLVMAADAYRIARAQVRESLVTGPVPPGARAVKPSRLPAFFPVSLAVLASVGFCALVVVGLAMRAARLTTPSLAGRSALAGLGGANRFSPRGRPSKHSAVEAEFLPAIQDIERIQREGKRDQDDLQGLDNDTNRISAALGSGELDDSDIEVAYFYRGVAASLSNAIRRKQGLQVDASVAQNALNDFNQVVSHRGSTYDPSVTPANAQYWSGVIQRNDLHSEADAYSSWNQCAQKGHPGCLNIMANAHITGKGGQAVDIPAALNMHLTVFHSGVRSRCAGAFSARSIARIVHFTGVHAPDGDELAWLQKAYDLMDKVPARGGKKNVCDRSSAEIEEFLYRLGRGEHRENLLPDARARLDDTSLAPRALIDLLSGKTSKASFVSAVDSDNSEDRRCSAYFDALWYANLKKNRADTQDYFQRMTPLGDFYCGSDLVFARKLAM